MAEWNRRRFISRAALAAGSGLAGWHAFGAGGLLAQAPLAGVPNEILNPVEVSGADAVAVMGKLPGQKRMYVLPADAGEYHRLGNHVMKRVARPADTGDVYELSTFTGNTGASIPRHAHLSSHAAVLVMRGEIEFQLADDRWTMMRGDFANLPPGTPHGWTMRSDGAQLAVFSMNDRVGAAFVAMGEPQAGPQLPTGAPADLAPAALARAAAAGDFQLTPGAAAGAAVRPTNKQLPLTPGAYVLADGGGERFGGNTFLARNANTTGQFLFIITEGGPGGGVGAHFHARHFENFFGLDGETLGWAYGKAVPLRMGDYFQAPPRNLHGFRLNQEYNRFAAFLTPGIFENFFVMMGSRGRGAGGGRGGDATPRGDSGARGDGGARGRGEFAAGPPDMFRMLQMSGRGPDGYPLDVHGPTLPLPPQDPVWIKQAAGLADRAALLAHAQALCGVPISREITPALRRALALKPRPEDFI